VLVSETWYISADDIQVCVIILLQTVYYESGGVSEVTSQVICCHFTLHYSYYYCFVF